MKIISNISIKCVKEWHATIRIVAPLVEVVHLSAPDYSTLMSKIGYYIL